MSGTTLVVWALALIIQNMSFTWVSRARNSGSLRYHALASVFSNGIWVTIQFMLVKGIMDAEGLGEKVFIGAFYTTFTVIGSVLAHHLLMKYVERGKLKVGG